MSNGFKALPFMGNVALYVGIATGFAAFIVLVELIFRVDLPEVVWGFIGMVLTKLFDIAKDVVSMYQRMLEDSLSDD